MGITTHYYAQTTVFLQTDETRDSEYASVEIHTDGSCIVENYETLGRPLSEEEREEVLRAMSMLIDPEVLRDSLIEAGL